jgi:hypothetical protein
LIERDRLAVRLRAIPAGPQVHGLRLDIGQQGAAMKRDGQERARLKLLNLCGNWQAGNRRPLPPAAS